MKIKYGKHFKTFLKIAISVLALYFVFTQIEYNSVLEIYKSSNPVLLFTALLAFIISKWIASIRLNRFFRSIEIFISELQNIRLYLLGMFYNLFLPGGIGGDGYKIYLLNKKTEIKTRKIFWSVLVDRLNGVYALFCLAVILGFFIDFNIGFNYVPILWVAIPIASAAFFLLLLKFSKYLIKVIPETTLLSFFVQGFQLLTAFLIFRALGGQGQVTEYLFIFLISSIVAMFPVSIGGVGLRELTFLYGSEILNLEQNISIALSLMFYIITAFTSFWGVYYSVRTNKLGI